MNDESTESTAALGQHTTICGSTFNESAISTGSGQAQVVNHSAPRAQLTAQQAATELRDRLLALLAEQSSVMDEIQMAQALPEVIRIQSDLRAEKPDRPSLVERVKNVTGLLTGIAGAVEGVDRLAQAIGRLPGL